jgi:hypothetical protein
VIIHIEHQILAHHRQADQTNIVLHVLENSLT